jgi:hypothetical protein
MRQIEHRSECVAPKQRRQATKIQLLVGAMAIGFVGSLAMPVQAQQGIDVFENRGIQFAEDTVVEFEFDKSFGIYQSTFGIVNLGSCSGRAIDTCQKTELFREVRPFDKDEALTLEDKRRSSLGQTRDPNDFVGTAGVTVLGGNRKKFTFQANTPYAFYLESVYVHDVAITDRNGKVVRVERRRENKPTIYSVNTESAQLPEGFAGLGKGGVRVKWDDTGIPDPSNPNRINPDADFNDFVVVAGGFEVKPNPCPPLR